MKDSEGKLLGRKIFELRQRRHMTQKQLAEAAGLSESALRSYELGDRNPKEKHFEGIAQALKVHPEAFSCREAISNLQAIHLLFGMEDQFGIAPADSAGCTLDSNNRPSRRLSRLEQETCRTGEQRDNQRRIRGLEKRVLSKHVLG